MPLIEEAHKAARLLLDHAYVRIVARATPDAACAAALLGHALRRESIDFHVSWAPRLDEPTLKALAEERPDCVLAIGLSGDAAAPKLPASRSIALDLAPSTLAADAVVHDDAALASLAHLVAAGVSRRNADLAPLALAGALAAWRHVGGLDRLDGEILRESVEAGVVAREAALALRGPTLLSALTQLDAPFVVGITGRARNAKKLVEDLALNGDAAPASVSGDDATRLGSFLALRLLQQDAPDAAQDALFRPALRALQGPLTGQECGEVARHVEAACAAGRHGLGFATLWADAAAEGAAREAAAATREELVAALLRAERDAKRDGRLVVAEAPRAALCRPLADRIAAALAPADAVTLVHAPDAGGAYVALRAWGVDVGAAARRAGGAGSAQEAHLWAPDATRAVKAVEEALA